LLNSIIAFLSYLSVSIALLIAFVIIYVKFTPYKEFELIALNNSAAAITLSGAILGFTFPLVASIYYTQSLIEMSLWAVITGIVQMIVFLALRRYAKKIEEGHIASSVMVATFSVAIGLLNAVCISH
jgi:putative membrane protein